MKSLLYSLISSALLFTQIPDVGAQIQLKAINVQLSKVVAQNQLGLTNDRVKVAKMIDAVRNTYQSFQQLKKLNDQREKFMKDLDAIRKYKINDLSDLKNFVLHGDQIDFWFKSSSRNMISDLNSLTRAGNSVDGLISATNNVFNTDEGIDKSLADVRKAEIGSFESNIKYADALPDQINMQIMLADQIKKLLNDPEVKMTQAERAQLLLLSQQLEGKTLDSFRDLQETSSKIIEQFKKTQVAKKNNRELTKFLKSAFTNTSSNANYGLFRSKDFKIKYLGEFKWGKNY